MYSEVCICIGTHKPCFKRKLIIKEMCKEKKGKKKRKKSIWIEADSEEQMYSALTELSLYILHNRSHKTSIYLSWWDLFVLLYVVLISEFLMASPFCHLVWIYIEIILGFCEQLSLAIGWLLLSQITNMDWSSPSFNLNELCRCICAFLFLSFVIIIYTLR
jgi:hypothetical protein